MSWRNYASTECGIGGITWNAAVAVLLELQRVTNVRLNVLHMMNPGMIRLVTEAKQDGRDVTCEVNPFALFLSDIERIAPLGPLAIGRCVPQDWVAQLWQAIADDVIDVVGTDHAPHTREEKEKGWENMWSTPSGTPQLQHYVPRLYAAAREGLVSVEDIVRTTATNPARRFGLYPRKGAIRVGADADLVVSCLSDEVIGTDENIQSKAGYNPYRGEVLVGIPRYTILRGKAIVDQGVLVGAPGYGQHVKPVSEPAFGPALAKPGAAFAIVR
jgi:dihydroorotase